MESQFCYRSLVQDIPLIRKDLSRLALSWKISDSDLKQIGIIIEELFSNIVRFAYNDSTEHIIEIKISLINEKISVHIVDDGAAFNPVEYFPKPNQDPAAFETGGMGLVLVKTFSDSLDYYREDQKNHLEISKTLRSK